MPPIVGIDLGTTYSLCAVFEEGSPRLLPNALGQVLTPSVVGVLEDGQVLVGAAARELMVVHPDRAAACFKRWMGTDRVAVLGGRRFTAQELSSLVLRTLKEDAETALGLDVQEAVITVPAYFNELQRQATRVAGQLAGLTVRRILNEPSAAALAYGLRDRHGDKKLLVFDLGGGTFDVTLMDVFEGTLEIVAAAGESHLGGEDFTDRIVQWVLQRHGLQLEQAEALEPHRVARLRLLAEAGKRALAGAAGTHTVHLLLPRADGSVDEGCPGVELDRAEYGRIVQPLLDRLMRPVVKALRDGRASVDEVDEVVLAGGATREPLVRAMVATYFGREPLCSEDPDTVVAAGAAVQAALLAEDAAVEDIVMTDVCPFTLGVEVSKEFGSQRRDGYFLPVIHRNTTIPVSREKFVSTVLPQQRSVTVRVFQGEARKVEGNLLLGSLEVSGIPPGPAGQELAIRFTYDVNGLLEVEAVIEATGRKFAAVFTHHVSNLGEREVAAARAQLQHLKFYPREDIDNQRLLLFAERSLGQVAPVQRGGLEAALDAYEAAFRGGEDRDCFARARSDLLLALSLLELPYEGGSVQ